MKRILCTLLCAAMLASLLAACNSSAGSFTDSSSQVAPDETSDATMDEIASEESSVPDNQSVVELFGEEVPGSEDDAAEEPTEETPAPDKDLNEIYEALAGAAGLGATLEVTMLDLNAGGGITTDNIVEMAAGQSKVGGDSGLVIVLYVENGTVDTMVAELEAYRDSLISGPAYEEFAEAKEATENARIEAFGNYVVYVAASADSGADYTAVDALLAVSLFM